MNRWPRSAAHRSCWRPVRPEAPHYPIWRIARRSSVSTVRWTSRELTRAPSSLAPRRSSVFGLRPAISTRSQWGVHGKPSSMHRWEKRSARWVEVGSLSKMARLRRPHATSYSVGPKHPFTQSTVPVGSPLCHKMFRCRGRGASNVCAATRSVAARGHDGPRFSHGLRAPFSLTRRCFHVTTDITDSVPLGSDVVGRHNTSNPRRERPRATSEASAVTRNRDYVTMGAKSC